MRHNFKKFFAVAVSLCVTCSYFGCANVFAGETDIVYYDINTKASTVNSVPDSVPVVSVVPSKDSLSVGDNFYVDIILENNPGFAAYGFTINYDPSVIVPVKGDVDEMDSVSQVTYRGGVPAISASQINSGIDVGASSGKLFRTNLLLDGGSLVETNENGILFRVNFKAVGEGNSYINYSDFRKVVFSTKAAQVFDVYVKNSEVTVSGGNKASSGEAENNGDDDKDNLNNENSVSDDNLNNKNDSSNDKKQDDDNSKSSGNENENKGENTSENTQTDTSKGESANDFIINIPRNMSASKEFGDLASVSWAKDSIIKLSSLGIINGVDAVRFSPKSYTYRADFVVVISRLLGLEGSADNVFSDVDGSSYYSKAVSLANKFGIVQGANGMFMPKSNITRQDAMVILSRVLDKAGKLKKSDVSVLNNFNDKASVSNYALSPMADLVGMGILNGDNNRNLNPKGFINRAEMAVVIDKIYDVLK